PKKRALVAVAGNQVLLEHPIEEGASTPETRRDQTGSEAAAVRIPLQRRADTTAVDKRGADARQRVTDVQFGKGRRVAHRAPTQPAENPRDGDQDPRSHPIDQPSVQRLNKRLQQNEKGEGPLD